MAMIAEDVRDDFGSTTNPVKAIRLKCRDCTCNQVSEIDGCTVKACPLHPFRFGKNPYRTKRVMSDERKETMGKHLEKARQQRTLQR